MSRTWIAAVVAASLSFAIAYAAVSAGAGSMDRATTPQGAVRLKASLVPDNWKASRIPGSRATLAYPASWRPLKGDRGTVSAALRQGDRLVGYLNATPQSGEETLANWLDFRPSHNREEGDTNVTPLAGSRGLSFRGGRGSCVVDGYTSSSGVRYRELACIVAGRRATTVVVGSTQPQHWHQMVPLIRRAISSFTT